MGHYIGQNWLFAHAVNVVAALVFAVALPCNPSATQLRPIQLQLCGALLPSIARGSVWGALGGAPRVVEEIGLNHFRGFGPLKRLSIEVARPFEQFVSVLNSRCLMAGDLRPVNSRHCACRLTNQCRVFVCRTNSQPTLTSLEVAPRRCG